MGDSSLQEASRPLPSLSCPFRPFHLPPLHTFSTFQVWVAPPPQGLPLREFLHVSRVGRPLYLALGVSGGGGGDDIG